MNSPSSSARLRPFRPQAFGRYTLLSHLATGGMGEIYLARLEGAQGFEKLCVIKKILPQLAADHEFVDRFVGEARTLVKLSHGSIAQVLDMGLHEGDAYMALEYVDGKDLRKVAGRVRDRNTPLPLTFVLFVMGRVLDALAYAHRKRDDDEKEINLVHRDISPQNILISYEGEVKVIDFGLAKSRLSAAKTNPSIILGKFLYMSPEQAKHQAVDRRSDLYAVGLCLYELISGKNPFDNVHPGELMSAVAHPRVAPLSDVEPFTPPAVAHMVMKALAVEPSQRFQTAEEFRGRLMGCLMEIDRNAGPESVSRFMRDLFAAEYQSERKLLAQLKDVPRGEGQVARVGTDVETDPGARFPPPSLPPRTVKLDAPSQPLSFQPTPRTRPGTSVHDEETRPGVVMADTQRPAVPFEALDAAARARVRPALATTSPLTETVTVEVRAEDFDRPSGSAATAAPVPLYSNSPTVEVPMPLMSVTASPPGAAQPPPGAPRAPEAPRPAMSAPPSGSMPGLKPMEPPRAAVPSPSGSMPGLKPMEPPRAAVPSPSGSMPGLKPPEPSRAAVPSPSGSMPGLKPPEPPRAAVPPLPGSPPVSRSMEPHRQGAPPPPPIGVITTEPHGLEVPAAYAPAAQSNGPSGSPPAWSPASLQPPPPPVVTPSEPMLAVRDVEPRGASRPSLDTTQPLSALELSAIPIEHLGISPEAASQAHLGAGAPRPTEPLVPLFSNDGISPTEASRRGLDDTHPSYQMASGAPPEDTQPRVVLDDEAFRESMEAEEQIIVSGVLEEAPSSTPARGKTAARRVRTGMTAAPRGAPARGATRPAELESSEPASNEDDEVEVDVDVAVALRDPREETRKTPLPTRPGESSRRAPREEPRRGTAPARSRKRSWAWIAVSLLLLAVAGSAVVVAYPHLEHLLQVVRSPQAPRAPPAVPLRPVAPGESPGTAANPSSVASAEALPAVPPGAQPVAPPGSELAARHDAVPAGTAGAAPGAGAEVLPSPGAVKPAGDEEAADDMFVPLPSAQHQTKKVPAPRSPKRIVRSREAAELQREWGQARIVYDRLVRQQSCESPKIGLLCTKFDKVKAEMDNLGEGYKKDLYNRVRKLRAELEKAHSSSL
ncbi:MAG: protein kinase [Myxococcaceae bacterium]|nr:protein kinase [Myxococcaceae bacterium]